MAVTIGLDFGNKRSYPSFVQDIDMKTRLGGTCHDLLPAHQAAGGGIPSSFFYSTKRGERVGMDAEATSAHPAANRRSMLKQQMNQTFVIDGKTFKCDDVIKKVVEHVVRTAQQELRMQFHTTSHQISLAYPVTFNSAKLRHLKNLVESIVIDGKHLKVTGTIAEPAAAALDYLAEHGGTKKETTVMAYDLGGGTFDLSIVTVFPEGKTRANGQTYYYDILSTNGDANLGGENFTECLQELFIRKMGGHPAGALADMLPAAAESAKIELSTRDRVEPMLLNRDGEYFDFSITRSEFEAAAKPLVERTVALMRKMFADHPHVDMILLTGGACQMPMILNTLRQAFPEYAPKGQSDEGRIKFHNPSRAISYGAARYGANEDSVQQRTLWDLGIQYVDTNRPGRPLYVQTLIPAGTPLPCEYKNTTVRTVVRTRHATSAVYEARVKNPDAYQVARDFRLLTSTQLDFGHEAPENTPVVDVLSIDANNILRVVTYDPANIPATRSEAKIEYKATE